MDSVDGVEDSMDCVTYAQRKRWFSVSGGLGVEPVGTEIYIVWSLILPILTSQETGDLTVRDIWFYSNRYFS